MKFHGLLISIFIFLLCGCDWKNNHPDPEKLLGSPPYAGLTDSIRRFPSNANLYLQRALLLSQNNQHELANADYKKAWQLDPQEATAMEYISNLLMVEKLNDAIRLLKECSQKYPSNIEFSRRLGELYIQAGKHRDALAQFDQILQKDSLNFEAWFDKGMLLAEMKDTTAAIRALERSYSIQPISYTGIRLANIYASTSNPKTLALCDEMIRKDSAHSLVDPLYIKGTYYSNTHHYEEALKQFDETIKRDWKFVEAYLDKGIILYEQKNYDAALQTFTMAATVSNTYPDAYFWMARCFEATGRVDQAIANYQRALALDHNFTEARDALKRLKS